MRSFPCRPAARATGCLAPASRYCLNNACQLSTTLMDVRTACWTSATSMRKRRPSREDCGVKSMPAFGGKGIRSGTKFTKAVPFVFTGAANTDVPAGAVLKTISLSTRHRGQLPWSLEGDWLLGLDSNPLLADAPGAFLTQAVGRWVETS